MTDSLLDNSTLSLLQKAAVFGERRHEILAGNIANISTPNYRMRDLPVREFQKALQTAVAQLNTAKTSTKTGARDSQPALDERFPKELFQAQRFPGGNITFHDANNRSIEQQTMELTKNSMMQNFLLELLRFQMNSLNTVISERL